MGRRISYIIILFVFIAATGLSIFSCDPIALRQLVEERVNAAGVADITVTIDASAYPAFVPNGSALAIIVSTEGDAPFTTQWSESSSHGIVFGDADLLTSTVSYTGWTVGEAVIEVTLSLTVTTESGDTSEEVLLRIFRTDYAYVTTTGVEDGSAPNKSIGNINNAINFADTTNRIGVAVATGTYDINSDSGQQVILVDGVSIFGGYSSSDWSRDLSSNTTIINNIGLNGPAVYCGQYFAQAILVDGFTINAAKGGAGWNTAIHIDRGSSPIIQNNAINGGSSSAGNSYGLYIQDDNSPVIRNNTIYGGDTAPSYGIYCQGLATYPCSPIIRNNTIDAGGSFSTANAGIFLTDDSNPTIENNIIFDSGTQGTGIYESSIGSDPASLKNNNFFGMPTYYIDNDTGWMSEVLYGSGYDGTLENTAFSRILTTPEGFYNRSENPQFVSSTNPRLTSSSTLNITGGGIDGSAAGWGFNTDKDGNPRTGNGSTGWSMGAYEYDP